MEMDLSFFFFILRFLQDTVIEEWMILAIGRHTETNTMSDALRRKGDFSKNVMQ